MSNTVSNRPTVVNAPTLLSIAPDVHGNSKPVLVNAHRRSNPTRRTVTPSLPAGSRYTIVFRAGDEWRIYGQTRSLKAAQQLVLTLALAGIESGVKDVRRSVSFSDLGAYVFSRIAGTADFGAPTFPRTVAQVTWA